MNTTYSYLDGALEMDWDDEEEPTAEHVYTDLELTLSAIAEELS